MTERDAAEEERRIRRARRRIYESIGVALFMTIVLLVLILYVKTQSP